MSQGVGGHVNYTADTALNKIAFPIERSLESSTEQLKIRVSGPSNSNSNYKPINDVDAHANSKSNAHHQHQNGDAGVSGLAVVTKDRSREPNQHAEDDHPATPDRGSPMGTAPSTPIATHIGHKGEDWDDPLFLANTPFGAHREVNEVGDLRTGHQFQRFEIVKEEKKREEELEEVSVNDTISRLTVRVSTIFLQYVDENKTLVWTEETGRQEKIKLSDIKTMGTGGTDELLSPEAQQYRSSLFYIVAKTGSSLHVAVPGPRKRAEEIRQVWLRTLHELLLKQSKKVPKANIQTNQDLALRQMQLRKQFKEENEDPSSSRTEDILVKPKYVDRQARNIKREQTRIKMMAKIGRNATMMQCLNIGLRVMLLRASNEHQKWTTASRSLEDLPETAFADFFELEFPPRGSPEGSELSTPAHDLKPFRFKDYAPEAFYRLRSAFGITEEEYHDSVCTEDNMYDGFVTNSKSGSFFFFTHDKKYMIKSHSKDESKFFRKKLPLFYKYYATHNGSLLSRFVGLHRVENPDIGKVHFIVMRNVFGAITHSLRWRFDLKGSSEGRNAKPEEKIQKTPVLKDNDFREMNIYIRLTKSKRASLLESLEKDCQLLSEAGIMDYSLLVGISETDKNNTKATENHVGNNTTATTFGQSPSAITSKSSDPDRDRGGGKSPHPSHYGIRRGQVFTKAVEDSGVNDRQSSNAGLQRLGSGTIHLGTHRKQASLGVLLDIDHGVASPDGEQVYFMGIIDILQEFNARKKAEFVMKRGRAGISCQPPKAYAHRFMEFFNERIIDVDEDGQPLTSDVGNRQTI